jgi:hypothetical protein
VERYVSSGCLLSHLALRDPCSVGNVSQSRYATSVSDCGWTYKKVIPVLSYKFEAFTSLNHSLGIFPYSMP